MPNAFASMLIACALSSACAAALAQPAPDPKVIEKQARSFVQAYAAASNPQIDQISRWHDPVCVQIKGLTDDLAAAITARIASVAQAQGLPAAAPGCRANVEIVFADQPQSTMDVIAQRQEPLLGYYHRERLSQLKTVTRPIQAWYTTATRGSAVNTGSLAQNGHATMANVGSGAMGFAGSPRSSAQHNDDVIDDPQNSAPVGCVDRFTSCYTSVLYNVIILVDGKAVVGKDMGLVADDITMLALSQPRSQDGCNALPSVLDAFAKAACPGRVPPTGLTAADAAYLSALYASQAEVKKATELSEMAALMAKTLIKASAASPSLPPADAKPR
jgi:hypothetical protein